MDWATLATNAVLVLATSLLTTQFAVRRFRSEKWWERKVQTYENIVGILHKLLNVAGTLSSASLKKSDDKYLNKYIEFGEKYNSLTDDFFLEVSRSKLLCSDQVYNRLREMIDCEKCTFLDMNAKNESEKMKFLLHEYHICLNDIIALAYKDIHSHGMIELVLSPLPRRLKKVLQDRRNRSSLVKSEEVRPREADEHSSASG